MSDDLENSIARRAARRAVAMVVVAVVNAALSATFLTLVREMDGAWLTSAPAPLAWLSRCGNATGARTVPPCIGRSGASAPAAEAGLQVVATGAGGAAAPRH